MRRLPFAAATAAGLAAARGLARRRPALQAVPRDLRNPVLWLPIELGSARAIRILRPLSRRAPMPKPPTGVRVEERELPRRDGGRVRVLVHEAEDRARPSGALLWIHGGGLVFGVPEQSADACNRLARELDVLVVNVDYRLAPENPFPAALDDCMDALRWLHSHADELGIDPSRVAVGGDSAGGGLSAAVAQRAHDEGDLPLAFQALLYPMLDDRTVLRTDHGDRGRFVWTPSSNRFGWTAYLGRPPVADDAPPYAAPARRADLGGLPPAWIGVGELDLFHDEDVDYARRLQAAGVPCRLHVQPGGYHAADVFAAGAPSSQAFRTSMVDALAEAIGPLVPA